MFDEEASKYRWWYYHKLDKSRFNYSLKDIFNEKGEYYNRAISLIINEITRGKLFPVFEKNLKNFEKLF